MRTVWEQKENRTVNNSTQNLFLGSSLKSFSISYRLNPQRLSISKSNRVVHFQGGPLSFLTGQFYYRTSISIPYAVENVKLPLMILLATYYRKKLYLPKGGSVSFLSPSHFRQLRSFPIFLLNESLLTSLERAESLTLNS